MLEKRKQLATDTSLAARSGRPPTDADHHRGLEQVLRVDQLLQSIPAEIISRRAVECKSFARALFHWEQYIRQEKDRPELLGQSSDLETLYERLQDIYTQIDEPDGIEGISSHLHVLNIDQQILEHRKAGRWTAAQSWYEILLNEKPDDVDVQVNLLHCLKESGQYGKVSCQSMREMSLTLVDVLLNQVDGLLESHSATSKLLPFAIQASWVAGKWAKLRKYVSLSSNPLESDFDIGLGSALLALHDKDLDHFSEAVQKLRQNSARILSTTNTASLQACHDVVLRFHALAEVEAISGARTAADRDREVVLENMGRRIDVLGAFLSEKQYLLGLRRAAMQLSL